jgi:hypothetical protein
MSDRFQTSVTGAEVPRVAAEFPPLPTWLANRVLRQGEEVTWVYGPKRNPSWERYATHPGLFLLALPLGGLCVAIGVPIGGEAIAIGGLAAGAILLATLFVVGFCSGHFTRLVVTNSRLLILQGYEVCRTWDIDRLPRSLLRYRMHGDAGGSWSVDLSTLKTMLGGTSDQFVDAKTILAFSKQLDRFGDREKPRE